MKNASSGDSFALTEDVPAGHLDIVVVCNGCRDGTAAAAREASDAIRVIELSTAGKHHALRAGIEAAEVFPLVLVDADVEISASGIDRLVEAVGRPGVLAAGPVRVVPRTGVHWVVRSYYDVWECLRSVRISLFGRGVIALSADGYERLGLLPQMMNDDLVISELFGEHERSVVPEAEVIIHPPKTVRDLHRRRVRASTGNVQADAAGLRRGAAMTTKRDLSVAVRQNPAACAAGSDLLARRRCRTLAARHAVRKGDFETWRRDETSRQ